MEFLPCLLLLDSARGEQRRYQQLWAFYSIINPIQLLFSMKKPGRK